jgi:uncharacterized protein DUF2567
MSLSSEEPKTAMNDQAPQRISRRRAALTVIVGLAVAGAAVGALWSWIAPGIHGVVALNREGERVRAYLGHEADNFFLAAFLLVGIVTVLAVVSSVLVWQWRAHRGPALVAALAVGSAAAAGAAAGVGAVLVHWRYGVIDVDGAPVSPEHRVHYVTEAPAVFFGQAPLQIAVTILLPAALAAFVYALIAVSTSRDDLGAWPPVEPVAALPSEPTTPVLPLAPNASTGSTDPS